MIVECTNCDTRFQLDDARVPLRGIRVRCSRCKEAFFLEHPDASRSDAINDVAEEAARRPGPDPTQDLPSRSPGRREAASSEPEEEDWEFNADFPGEDPNESSRHDFGGGERSDFGGGEHSDFGDGGSQIGLDESVSGLDLDDVSVDDDDLASDLDLAGSGSGFGASDDDALSGLTDGDDGDFGEAMDFSASAGDTGQLSFSRDPTSVGSGSGGSEDWNFFSDDSGETPELASTDDAMDREGAAVASSRRRGRSRGPELGAARAGSARLQAVLATAGRALGWMATCALLGVGLMRGVLDVSTAGARPITSVDLGPFRAEQVHGTWLESARSTHLYAVSGRLVNASGKARAPGPDLRVVLTSPRGERLEELSARLGAPLGEGQLRELAAPALAAAADRAASQLAGMRVAPGGTVPFLAFFDGVPEIATGFVIEAEAFPPPLADTWGGPDGGTLGLIPATEGLDAQEAADPGREDASGSGSAASGSGSAASGSESAASGSESAASGSQSAASAPQAAASGSQAAPAGGAQRTGPGGAALAVPVTTTTRSSAAPATPGPSPTAR